MGPTEVGKLIYISIPVDAVDGHKNHTNNDTPDNRDNNASFNNTLDINASFNAALDNNASDNKGNASDIVEDNIAMRKTGIPIY